MSMQCLPSAARDIVFHGSSESIWSESMCCQPWLAHCHNLSGQKHVESHR